MAAFQFEVNQSFLARGHAITIPKREVDYGALESEGLDQRNLVVIFPKGERFGGKLHHGKAGYGEYYQLWIHGGALPRYVKLHHRLIVALLKVGGLSYAVLEYQGPESVNNPAS